MAQEGERSAKFRSGFELGGAFCYTGLNMNLAYSLAWRENTFFLGPKITLSDSYIPTRGPWGIHAGYRRLFPGEGNFRTFVSFDYQLVFLEPFNSNNFNVNGKNEIHELLLSYGIQLRVWKNLIIGNSIGAGVYFERFAVSISDSKNTFEGFNGQFRLFAQYSF